MTPACCGAPSACSAERERIEFPAAYRDWIETVYAEDPWDDEPDTTYGGHLAWRDDQRAAAARAIQLTTMTLTQFRDDDERATGLTRDGEMSLTVLPLLADGCLLDGQRLSALDDHARAEALLLNAAPAPRSWEKWLKGCDRDDDGRIKLAMEPTGPDAWVNAGWRFRLLGRVRTGEVGVGSRNENRSRYQRFSWRHTGRRSLKPGGCCLLARRSGAAHGNGAAG